MAPSLREDLRQRRFLLHQAGCSLAGINIIESAWEGAGADFSLPNVEPGLWSRLPAGDQRSLKAMEPQIGYWIRLYEEALAKGWKFLILEEIKEALAGLGSTESPAGLWCHGTLDLTHWRHPVVAIVGSRRASAYGVAVAERLARSLARAGVVVISGLAYGIDVAAHRGSLQEGAPTVAVLGTGLDQNYPSSHRSLQGEAIPSNGLAVTEFGLGEGPQAHHFPQRNRIIAALAQAVVVVEGDVASGSLITARHAARLGKDVWAVPGSIFAAGSAGPHALIKDGAICLSKPEDLLESLPEMIARAPRGLEPWKQYQQQTVQAGSLKEITPVSLAIQEKILKHLSGEPMNMDQLLSKSGLGLEEASRALLELEMEGRIVSGAYGYERS
ncbi:MAG: DNA-protecting protein DprA [Elusimicrobia bacterium]|nr:DNA-protecting protein DprA [Elusimicrobiota bacterium]